MGQYIWSVFFLMFDPKMTQMKWAVIFAGSKDSV